MITLLKRLYPPSYSFLAVGTVGALVVLALLSRPSPDASAITTAATAPISAPPEASVTPAKFPELSEIFNEGFGPLKAKGGRLAAVVAQEPPDPPPLATVAAAEATAPKSPDPCELTVRRLARTTAVPVKQTIFDDIEAKYELIRVNDNQRFLAIRSACVKRDHPKRG